MAAEMSPKKYMGVFLNKGTNRWEFVVRYKGAVYRGSSQTQMEAALGREVEIFGLKLQEELKAKRNFPEMNKEEIQALLAEINEARIAEANLMEERRAFADKKSQFSPSSSSYVTVAKERDTVEEIFRTLQDAFDQLTIYMPSDSPQDHSTQHESELRDDRDRQVAKVQALAAKFAKLPACIKNIMTVKSNELKELQNRLEEAQIRIQEGDNLREKLHNTILELKGSLRVFCRVRPTLPRDKVVDPEATPLSFPSTSGRVRRRIDLAHEGQKFRFTFDHVFLASATQEDVYLEISELVQSFLDGYKVCIFAYGQSGSGKTYTMIGDRDDVHRKGIIPRVLDQVFESRKTKQFQGYQVSMLEIYVDKIRDLLLPNCPGDKKCEIKRDPKNGDLYVENLTWEDVSSKDDVYALLDRASRRRSVRETNLNEQSSRSHFVFALRILDVNESTKQHVQRVLSLVDLAGSEDVKESGVSEQGFKEARYINSSLSALKSVISALAKKSTHVPFRDTLLTRVLQSSLGGDSKVVMVLNLSPAPASAGDTLNSLRFGADAKRCQVSCPESSAAKGQCSASTSTIRSKYRSGKLPEIPAVKKSGFVPHQNKKLHYEERIKSSTIPPTFLSEKGSKLQPISDSNEGDARAISLFALSLERIKCKMQSSVRNKSAQILTSAAEGIQLQLKTTESQIKADILKLSGINKSKRKCVDVRYEEVQGQLSAIHVTLKDDVNRHLQDCRSAFAEGLDAHLMEPKGIVEKQDVSHRKLLLEAEKTIETQLSDAKRITEVHRLTRENMIQLICAVADCFPVET